jgi:CRISPR-associated endonuclease/helicase Cas3
MEYLAHFDRKRNQKQSLSTHLHNVSKYCELAVPPTVSFPRLSITEVKEISQLLGLFHDVGKYTDAFQMYLTDRVESNMKNHAHISAFYTHSFTMRLLSENMDLPSKYAWAFITFEHSTSSWKLDLKGVIQRREYVEDITKTIFPFDGEIY